MCVGYLSLTAWAGKRSRKPDRHYDEPIPGIVRATTARFVRVVFNATEERDATMVAVKQVIPSLLLLMGAIHSIFCGCSLPHGR